MTPEQVSIVQRTFDDVRPMADAAAQMFYTRLFTLDPSLRGLFKGDMETQGRKLMQALAMAVAGLKTPESIMPVLVALGARHRDYGVQPGHYDTVGTALLWTLEQGLGPAFTPEVHEAWATAYGVLAGAMQSGSA